MALAMGLLLSAAAVLHASSADGVDAPPDPASVADADSDPPNAAATPQREPEPEPASDPATVVFSAHGDLPPDLAARAEADPALLAATLVRGDTLGLVATWDASGAAVDELPPDWRFPVEVLAVEPAGYVAVLGVDDVTTLAPDEALLSESSATVRRVGVGGRLRFVDGTEVTVTGVLPDELLGAGEVVVTTASPLAPTRPRYLLATRSDPDDDGVLERYREVGEHGLVAVHGGEVPVLRHAADVMAPVRLKRAFGEFALTDGPGRWVQQGATWLRTAYQEQEVPIIGLLECHEAMFAPLSAALQDLVDRGLAHLVDPDDSDGCWAPRVQAGTTPSSHAWGIAIDINVQGNHFGATPTMPDEVIEAFARQGFVWGGDWLIPDGMHFELVVDRAPGDRWDREPTAGG
jgi:hypothetical protein